MPGPAKKATTVYVGGSFTMMLFVLFFVLKMVGVITWSWWWVTAPLWVPLATVLILYIIIGILFAGAFLAIVAWAKWR